MTEMTIKRDPEILAAEIRTLQQQAQGILLSYAIEIGKRLYEAKNALHHGEWGTWLAEKVQYSQSTANNYMKLYDRYGQEQVSLFGGGNSDSLKNLPYTKALKLLALSEEEALLCSHLSDVPRDADEVLLELEMPSGKALSILTKLTLTGVVENIPGQGVRLK